MLEFPQKRRTTRDLLAFFLVEDVGKTRGVVNRGWECERSPTLRQHELQLECTVRRLTIALSRSTAATGRRRPGTGQNGHGRQAPQALAGNYAHNGCYQA